MESRNAPLFLANRPPRRSVGAGFDCDSRLRLAFGERGRMCSGGSNDGCCRGHNHTVAFSFSRRGLIARHRRPDRRSARGLSQSEEAARRALVCRAAARLSDGSVRPGSARFVVFLSAMSSTKKGGPSPTEIRDEPLKPPKSHQNPGRGTASRIFLKIPTSISSVKPSPPQPVMDAPRSLPTTGPRTAFVRRSRRYRC